MDTDFTFPLALRKAQCRTGPHPLGMPEAGRRTAAARGKT